MADKEISGKVETTESHEKKVTDKAAAAAIDPKKSVGARKVPQWVIWLVIGIVVVAIAFVIMIMGFVHDARQLRTQPQTSFQTTTRQGFGGGRGFGGGSYYTQSSATDGPTTTTTTTKYTYTQGVVTQVNSGNIVVAGNGKTQTITTNSSTTYDDTTKPAVNDTVVIVGTADSNNVVTATEIRVENN